MSNVDKEYQKRFIDKLDDVSDFDLEGLWSTISTEVQPKKKEIRVLFLWLFLSLLMLSAGTLLWLKVNKPTSHSSCK
ncbi:MAG: hypothetical protein ACJATI_005478 [Halioglobus sp.]|jgi:hypothetical protein